MHFAPAVALTGVQWDGNQAAFRLGASLVLSQGTAAGALQAADHDATGGFQRLCNPPTSRLLLSLPVQEGVHDTQLALCS